MKTCTRRQFADFLRRNGTSIRTVERLARKVDKTVGHVITEDAIVLGFLWPAEWEYWLDIHNKWRKFVAKNGVEG